jgi:hypothetical protein
MVGNRRQFLGFAALALAAKGMNSRSTRCRLASGETRATTGWS